MTYTKKNISLSAYVIYFLQVLLVIPDNSLSLWTSFLSLVSSRWDNDRVFVCLTGRAVACVQKSPTLRKKSGKDSQFFLREGGSVHWLAGREAVG